MRQSHSSSNDSVGKSRRNRRGAPQEKVEKTNQNQANPNSIKKPHLQASKKENPKDDIRSHFDNLLKCIKTNKKKQYLLSLAGISTKAPQSERVVKEKTVEEEPKSNELFISKFFFDSPSEKSHLNFELLNDSKPYSSNTNLGDHFGHSYFSIQKPPKYSCPDPHFVDFICNSLYEVQAVGNEGENKKYNEDNIISLPPADIANLKLSDNIDMQSIKAIQYYKLHRIYLDEERKKEYEKDHKINNDEEFLNRIVHEKMCYDDELRSIEDDRKFIYRSPINLSLNEPNISASFKFSDLHFLYYMLILIESKTLLTPHNKICSKPISTCLKHFIPLLLSLTVPKAVPWKQSAYYLALKSKFSSDSPTTVETSLSPIANTPLFDKEIQKSLMVQPELTFKERNWPCHLILPPLHVRYLIILFDLLSRLNEYFHEMPYIPFRAAFGLNPDVRPDSAFKPEVRPDSAGIPSEFKRIQDCLGKDSRIDPEGGSLSQKLYDLRNISYQIISVNGLLIFDRHLQIFQNFFSDSENCKLEDAVLTEESLFEKTRHDIFDQKPLAVRFNFDEGGNELRFNFRRFDQRKLKVSKKYSETFVFPNYSICTLLPVFDETLVKHDGIFKSNMTFTVSGSSDPSDDQFHANLEEGSYGIICNYTDLI